MESVETSDEGELRVKVRTGWNRVIEQLVPLFRREPPEERRYNHVHRTVHSLGRRRQPNRTKIDDQHK